MTKKILQKNKGFTLVEMMVSVSLFVIVALIVSMAFVTLANVYRKIQSNRAVVDNINFMMDTISYELREGTNWKVSNSDGCEDGNYCYTAITFDRFNDFSFSDQVTYKLNSATKSVDQCVTNSNDPSKNGCVALNSPEVKINKFKIYTDTSQLTPKANLLIYGTAQATPKIITDFTLQTTVSQRNL